MITAFFVILLQCSLIHTYRTTPLSNNNQINNILRATNIDDVNSNQKENLIKKSENIRKKSFYIETHGCQMNLADSDVVRSVLLSSGYEMNDQLEEADLILINTCAIRENAESKIWQRLKYFESIRKKNKKLKLKNNGAPFIGILGCMAERLKTKIFDEVGVNFIAGPDAYRDLPNLIPEFQNSDIGNSDIDLSDVRKIANVQLSMDETYADIAPVRLNEGNIHAFVTITRGCDNHCAFCIVPYTRGKERSRPTLSILEEVKKLTKKEGFNTDCVEGLDIKKDLVGFNKNGLNNKKIENEDENDSEIKEIVLLGQNVNSYWDKDSFSGFQEDLNENKNLMFNSLNYKIVPGFEEKKKIKSKGSIAKENENNEKIESIDLRGVRFAELLYRVSQIDPEVRIRFQSPHPKDFPTPVLQLIADNPNICNSLHMPAQHGSTSVLQRMQRGYSREAYLNLVQNARKIIAGNTPAGIGLGLSSDFISGFCGETEEEHQDLISLLQEVGFDQAFTYSYSRRDQTYAGLHLEDDVLDEVKSRRLQEVIDTFQLTASIRNSLFEVGRLHLVLVEGFAKKGTKTQDKSRKTQWTGRTDTNKRIIFSDPSTMVFNENPDINDINQQNGGVLNNLSIEEAREIALLSLNPTNIVKPNGFISKPNSMSEEEEVVQKWVLETLLKRRKIMNKIVKSDEAVGRNGENTHFGEINKGKYVIVKVLSNSRGHTLRGVAVAISTLQHAHTLDLPNLLTR